jgi:hypothetical protein
VIKYLVCLPPDRRIFAVSSCAAGAWPQIQIDQLCACALIAGQRDVFASGVRTSSTSVAFPVLNDS